MRHNNRKIDFPFIHIYAIEFMNNGLFDRIGVHKINYVMNYIISWPSCSIFCNDAIPLFSFISFPFEIALFCFVWNWNKRALSTQYHKNCIMQSTERSEKKTCANCCFFLKIVHLSVYDATLIKQCN